MHLKYLEQGEHKKTPSSMVIVSDKFLEVKQSASVQGLLRVVLYLEDLGVASKRDQQATQSPGQVVAAGSGNMPI